MTSTYSFSDVSLVLSHPSVGKYTFSGQGLGSIALSYSGENSSHDVAADGSVMVSKVVTKNGTMALAIQQTSAANTWLKKWYNYLLNAPTSEWAKTSAVLSNPSMGETASINGITPTKLPDANYQQAGQQVQWSLLCAEINF